MKNVIDEVKELLLRFPSISLEELKQAVQAKLETVRELLRLDTRSAAEYLARLAENSRRVQQGEEPVQVALSTGLPRAETRQLLLRLLRSWLELRFPRPELLQQAFTNLAGWTWYRYRQARKRNRKFSEEDVKRLVAEKFLFADPGLRELIEALAEMLSEAGAYLPQQVLEQLVGQELELLRPALQRLRLLLDALAQKDQGLRNLAEKYRQFLAEYHACCAHYQPSRLLTSLTAVLEELVNVADRLMNDKIEGLAAADLCSSLAYLHVLLLRILEKRVLPPRDKLQEELTRLLVELLPEALRWYYKDHQLTGPRLARYLPQLLEWLKNAYSPLLYRNAYLPLLRCLGIEEDWIKEQLPQLARNA
ncbi:MAG: hypothetical protein GXO42_02655 [bacterium]|nr:hypothetical protein [bacterium]